MSVFDCLEPTDWLRAKVAIEHAALPTDTLPNPLAVPDLQKISAINLSKADAALLEMTTGYAVLRNKRTSPHRCTPASEKVTETV